MRYTPKIKVEELLLKAGYTREGSTRGWTKLVREIEPFRTTCIVVRANKKTKLPMEKGPRFHALITDGEIDLHIDHTVGDNHQSKKFTPGVINEVHRLERIDLALQ